MLLKRTDPVDWFRLVVDLKARGWSVRRIGDALGLPESTVRAWKAGCTPNFEDGLAFARLHAKECGPTVHTITIIQSFELIQHNFAPSKA